MFDIMQTKEQMFGTIVRFSLLNGGVEMKQYSRNRQVVYRESYEVRRDRIFAKQKARQKREAVIRFLLGCFVILAVLVVTFHVFTLKGKAQSSEQKFKYYTSVQLQSGDTLWDLADQYMDKEMNTRTSFIAEVKSINHISDENEIIAGKLLIVPYYSTEYIAD